VQSSLAQSRPRRVGQTSPPQQTPSPEPQDETTPTQTARPSQAPVLGGANRNPNEQQPAGQKKDAGPEEVGAGDVVKVDTTLVSIPVSVMDRDGKYVPDLVKENFRVWENGVEQRVAYFASTEKPFTVALVIDTSGSTRFRLEEIQEAAIAFVQQLRTDDKVMVVTFSDRIRVLCQPTNDRGILQSKLRQIEPGGGTKLYDAVDQVINKELSHVDGRKAIVLFTDGVDTTSKHATYESTVRDAEELDALIYPVEYDTLSDMGIFGPGGGGGGYPRGGGGGGTSSGGSILDVLGAIINGGGGGGGSYPRGGGGGGGRGGGRGGGGWPGGAGTSREEYALADRYLHELARVSGARLYNAEQQNLDAAFRSVAEELRRQYSLGYYPKNSPQPGERREVKVRVDRPELVVRTRDSYVFQSGANTADAGAMQTKPPVLKKDLIGKR
jgi:VWFA-related protein